MLSIYLYPSLCLFEGTVVSVGRGTKTPFQVVGHPDFEKDSFAFVPMPVTGAKHPKLEESSIQVLQALLERAAKAVSGNKIKATPIILIIIQSSYKSPLYNFQLKISFISKIFSCFSIIADFIIFSTYS